MKIRWVGRYDEGIKLLRLFSVIGTKGTVGDGKGFSYQLTVGARLNKLFGLVLGYQEVIATAFGVRVHLRRSFGGRFA
jgi:hypothetical protein